MLKNYFFISLLIITSCTNNEYIEIVQLSIFQNKFILNDTTLTQIDPSTRFISIKLEEQIDSALNINTHYLALTKFEVPGMISAKARSYDLVLIYLVDDSSSYDILITTDSSNTRLIDILSFDKSVWKLKAIYLDSSVELSNVIAIDILQDSTSDRINLVEHRLEVTPGGHFTYKYTISDLKSIFSGLNDTCPQCGSYTFDDKEVSVNVEIRQGIKPESVAYYFVLTSSSGCSEHYVWFANTLVNGMITINDHIKMEFVKNDLFFILKDYNNGCDEMQIGGEFILQKTQ